MADRQPAPKRQYPRTELKVKARVLAGDRKQRQFEATLGTQNVSVGGIFFQSTFFLKVGSAVEVELTLPEVDRPVRAKGRVVRVEQAGPKGRSGFAVQFTEYLDGSDVALASYFLGPVVREFVDEFLSRYARQFRVQAGSLTSMADLIAAWELYRQEAQKQGRFPGASPPPPRRVG